MSSEHTYTFKQPSEQMLGFFDTKPNHNITFRNGDKQVGALDFNGPEMTFSGDADESAKVFFDFIAKSFKARLEQERADEREACAKVCEEYDDEYDVHTKQTKEGITDAIRARSNT